MSPGFAGGAVGIEIGEAQAERIRRKGREDRKREDFMRGFYQK